MKQVKEKMKKPIGIFDSGVGGLTVFKEIRKRFPHEDIVYFGDTARVPYGPKSPETIRHYSLQNARFLLQHQAKMIVVACNTASSYAINTLSDNISVPLIGVIKPGARAAVAATQNNRIGIIGTYGTVNSEAYQNEIKQLKPEIEVFAKACPLFVPLVEEGCEEHAVAYTLAAEYLETLIKADIDTLILGCTHYPVMKKTIRTITKDKIKLIDSAEVIAYSLSEILPEPEKDGTGLDLFFVSDNEKNFNRIATRILRKEPGNLQKVRSGESWFVK